MKEVAIVPPTAQPECRCRVILRPFAQLAAEAQVGIWIIAKRDILNRVPKICPLLWVTEITVVFVVSQRLVCRRLRLGRRYSREKNRPQQYQSTQMLTESAQRTLASKARK